ncbi:MAG: T9SS type A sorting domain-containing protein [Cryomorphaceae bacterium]|nr:T9SS type A sorting domain-containing protein [Cryomorphaceae bacterium]
MMISFLFPQLLRGQIVVSTISGTNYTGANGVSNDAAVTFVVENTTNDPFLLTDLEAFWQTVNNNTLVELWVTTTSLSGPAAISAPVWTSIATGGPIAVPSNGYYPTLSNINYTIAPNTTYRFALRSSIGIRYSGAAGPPTPSTFSSAGILLHSGDYQINSLNIGYGGSFTNPSNTPRWFTGAISLIPMTISEDIALTGGELKRGDCLSNNDTIEFTITNTIGSTVNLAVDSVTVHWDITGPVNSSGTMVFNTDTLPLSQSQTKIALGVDLSVPGIYELNAYIDSSGYNQILVNDTLTPFFIEVREVISVSPASDTIFNNQDSVEISVVSPFMPGGDFFITEICHFKTTNGAPTSGWPAYLIADDYIEITGVPNSDLEGYTLEQWNATSLLSTYTFPPGTIMSPDGTAIIAVGQMGSSVESPANFYYHGNGTYTGTFGSTTTAGRIIKNPNGVIIDAVVYGSMSFPAASGVTPADWSGTTPAVSSAGNKLRGAYTKDATNWVNAGSAGIGTGQTPNQVNLNVVVPTPSGVSGLTWSINGVVFDTIPETFAGPFSAPGHFWAVATYISPCGILKDSILIVVDFPYCADADSIEIVDNRCDEIDLAWTSGSLLVGSKIEYGQTGFSQGTGTMVIGVSSPHTLSGLAVGTGYDVYVYDSCSDGNVSAGTLFSFTTDDSLVAGTINYMDDSVGGFTFTTNADPGTLVTWHFGDGNTGVGDSVFHQYPFGGNYNVMMIVSNSCGADTAYLTVTFVSVDRFGLENLKVYPNPGNGQLIVDGILSTSESVYMECYDVNGRNLFVRKIDQGKQKVELDLSHLSNGTYYLRVYTEGQYVVKPLIIIK